MTTTSETRKLKRETATIYRRRPLVIELGAHAITIREKGARKGYVVDYQSIYEMGAKKKAEADRAERKGRGRRRP